jgi:hypothetical protein
MCKQEQDEPDADHDRRIRIDRQDIRLAGCAACRNVRRKLSKRIKPGVSEAASHRRGYVSSFWNFSDAGERSGKVTK